MHIDEAFRKQSDAFYHQAAHHAGCYFQTLLNQVSEEASLVFLTKEIEIWKKVHTNTKSGWKLRFSQLRRVQPAASDYRGYLQWLNQKNRLEDYLTRSISYIYMRDLGRDLRNTGVQASVKRAVDSMKGNIISQKKSNLEIVNMSWLYRKSQEAGVEATFLWLLGKLKTVAAHIPAEMNADQAQRKLIKIIVGVLIHEIEEMEKDIPQVEKSRRLDEAIRLGYAYGLTYPFIDDLLDARILSPTESKQYADLIRETLLTGVVPPLDMNWSEKNIKLITFVHTELSEAFLYIRAHQSQESVQQFHQYAYSFFQSQEIDRDKLLADSNYTNEQIYVPVILKAAFSRLMIRSILDAEKDLGTEKRIFYYGLYNQLADDFADIFEDLEHQVVTPYTYYLTHRDKRPDIINPFQLYWVVIAYLLREVFTEDEATRDVILSRAINGLKRLKQKVGTERYQEIMSWFPLDDLSFSKLIQSQVDQATDVDFLDKLLRDQILEELKKDREGQEWFEKSIKDKQKQLNQYLSISLDETKQGVNDFLIEAANYSLSGDGKRIRPIIAWVMGVEEYGLSSTAILPVLKSIELMHTGSLILDDLPSQDNACMRRGRATLHEVYPVSTAELTSMFLIQKAVEEETMLDDFDAKTVLQMIRYTAQRAADMCRGQAMDLNAQGKELTLEELNTMCYYKTGIAFEVSLVIPAILAARDAEEIELLQRFSRHAGIAFQIKDDLLDVEGDSNVLGKIAGQDRENHSSTFVSVLGVEGARKEMWEHYCLAMESMRERSWKTTFLKHLLNYIVNREK